MRVGKFQVAVTIQISGCQAEGVTIVAGKQVLAEASLRVLLRRLNSGYSRHCEKYYTAENESDAGNSRRIMHSREGMSVAEYLQLPEPDGISAVQ